MFKKGLLTIIFLATACMARAQVLHYKVINVGSGNYYIGQNAKRAGTPFLISIAHQAIAFKNTAQTVGEVKSFGISPDHSIVGVLTSIQGNYKVQLFENPGDKLSKITSLSFGAKDPSLKVYPLNNGGVIIRSNIAHFDIYKPDGNIQASFSNSSGSLQGETISKLVMDHSGSTIIAYNPKIEKKNHVESRIQRVNPLNGQTSDIYYNEHRAISKIRISHNGQFLAVSLKEGHKSQIVIMDRYGNIIHTFHFDYKIDHFAFSNNDDEITMVQGNSVRVFNTLTGHKIGSAYLRGYDVTYATYIPGDHVILGLGTDYNSGSDQIHKVDFSLVNLKMRKIASKTYSGNLTWHPEHFPIHIRRLGRDHYLIEGFSSPIRLKADF